MQLMALLTLGGVLLQHSYCWQMPHSASVA
jgi:hypothetical protein